MANPVESSFCTSFASACFWSQKVTTIFSAFLILFRFTRINMARPLLATITPDTTASLSYILLNQSTSEVTPVTVTIERLTSLANADSSSYTVLYSSRPKVTSESSSAIFSSTSSSSSSTGSSFSCSSTVSMSSGFISSVIVSSGNWTSFASSGG